MSIRVYGAEQNPATDHFLYRCSCSSGASAIASGRGVSVVDGDGRRAIQLLEGADTCDTAEVRAEAESIGAGLLIPFAKSHNYGDRLHYEIPMAGDKGMRRYGLFTRTNKETGIPEIRSHQIHVSGRNLFAQQQLPA